MNFLLLKESIFNVFLRIIIKVMNLYNPHIPKGSFIEVNRVNLSGGIDGFYTYPNDNPLIYVEGFFSLIFNLIFHSLILYPIQNLFYIRIDFRIIEIPTIWMLAKVIFIKVSV
jgi:hypothetical protein